MGKHVDLIVPEVIEKRILLIRGQKVMLSIDLAALYEVEHRTLMQAARRNQERFPDDFMFQITKEEFGILKSRFVTSSWGGIRKLPYAFTEQGVAMLSSVLKSKRAVQVNIEIMRAFVKLREILSTHKDLARKLEELEKKYDERFRVVFEAIRQLMSVPTLSGRDLVPMRIHRNGAPPEKPRKQIAFRVEERKAVYKVRRRSSPRASVRM